MGAAESIRVMNNNVEVNNLDMTYCVLVVVVLPLPALL